MKLINNTKLDLFLWILTLLIAVSGIISNFYFSEIVLLVRFIVGMIFTSILILLISNTFLGKQFLSFFKDAKMELSKVVWSSKDEVTRTTSIVALLVLVMSVILWGLDSALLFMVSWCTK